MSFIPQTPVEPSAVAASLRVAAANNVHAGERIIDVTLDTLSDVTHQSTVLANAGFLSAAELQQSLLGARSYQDVWTAFADHSARLRDHGFKFLDECIACHRRACDRLYAEDGYGND